jgi:beta-lactamase class A
MKKRSSVRRRRRGVATANRSRQTLDFRLTHAVLGFVRARPITRQMRHAACLVPFIATVLIACSSESLASAASDGTPGFAQSEAALRLHALAPALERLADQTQGLVAVTVGDLQTGNAIAINGGVNLPAASTIKVAVMVEVFRQISLGRFGLGRTVSLLDRDRDCGYGDLCDGPWGAQYRVADLLDAMIDDSDNTAANMLIRLVGRQHVNQTMAALGLPQTRLGDTIHSDGDIRGLRTSADDMLRLLTLIASRRVIDTRSSDMMLALLAGQRHNTLLPAPLPKSLVIAHKTGTLHDTLNDVGIVELDGAPYVICAFSTHLADLDDGERFIRRASLLTFESFQATAQARSLSNARL